MGFLVLYNICPMQLEDKFSKKAIQMFSESAGITSSPGAQTQAQDEPETVSLLTNLNEQGHL